MMEAIGRFKKYLMLSFMIGESVDGVGEVGELQ